MRQPAEVAKDLRATATALDAIGEDATVADVAFAMVSILNFFADQCEAAAKACEKRQGLWRPGPNTTVS